MNFERDDWHRRRKTLVCGKKREQERKRSIKSRGLLLVAGEPAAGLAWRTCPLAKALSSTIVCAAVTTRLLAVAGRVRAGCSSACAAARWCLTIAGWLCAVTATSVLAVSAGLWSAVRALLLAVATHPTCCSAWEGKRTTVTTGTVMSGQCYALSCPVCNPFHTIPISLSLSLSPGYHTSNRIPVQKSYSSNAESPKSPAHNSCVGCGFCGRTREQYLFPCVRSDSENEDNESLVPRETAIRPIERDDSHVLRENSCNTEHTQCRQAAARRKTSA